MSQFSQAFSVKSNARRAAKKAGINPNSVRSCTGGWHFPLVNTPSPTKAKQPAAVTPAKTKKPKAEPKLKLEGGTGKKRKPKLEGVDHRGKVLQMILRDGGAKMSELEKETGLLPHTLRARISEIKRAEKLNVKRERLLGVTIYSATRK